MQDRLRRYLNSSELSVCYISIEQLPLHNVYVGSVVEENLFLYLLSGC